MKLRVEITGDLQKLTKREIALGESAATQAMRAAAVALKTRWREDIIAAGLGTRLSKAVQSESYPEGENSLNAAAMVWTNAPKIIKAHQEGVTIRSKKGLFLAIPTPAAGKSLRGGRVSPAEWERRTGLRLQFVYRRNGPSLLVAEGRQNSRGLLVESRSKKGRNRASAVIFTLVPQVKLPKRLDLYASAEQVAASIPAAIVAKWRST